MPVLILYRAFITTLNGTSTTQIYARLHIQFSAVMFSRTKSGTNLSADSSYLAFIHTCFCYYIS